MAAMTVVVSETLRAWKVHPEKPESKAEEIPLGLGPSLLVNHCHFTAFSKLSEDACFLLNNLSGTL